MATQTKKPATTLRCGDIKAAIWMNAGEKGAFYSATFSRPFKDAHGNWNNSASFGLSDLDAISILASQAKQWIADHAAR
jgi:hypothetical protein